MQSASYLTSPYNCGSKRRWGAKGCLPKRAPFFVWIRLEVCSKIIEAFQEQSTDAPQERCCALWVAWWLNLWSKNEKKKKKPREAVRTCYPLVLSKAWLVKLKQREKGGRDMLWSKATLVILITSAAMLIVIAVTSFFFCLFHFPPFSCICIFEVLG